MKSESVHYKAPETLPVQKQTVVSLPTENKNDR